MIDVGQPAPEFTLLDQDGSPVTLSELRGRPVVVYFYPRSDTRGCTTQACGIRDHWSEFEAAGAAVLGISPDDVDAQARFVAKYDLPHTILADPDKAAIEAYGSWGERVRRGETVIGVQRNTVLVAPDGTVARVWTHVDPAEHADDVLAAIAELDG